ncbi:50S ribosomal protein L20 [Candidatus Kaiserbacteria bacterium]|nr:50S ribosomal protein L20 [Candidatus Kaiserbacteria bacterium]
MSRVKGGVHTLKRRRSILKQVKGYRQQRSNKERAARDAIFKAGTYAFRDRRAKKRDFRGLWNIRINAGVRLAGFPSYSTFMGALKKRGIALDRKILSTLAKDYPETFNRIVALVK